MEEKKNGARRGAAAKAGKRSSLILSALALFAEKAENAVRKIPGLVLEKTEAVSESFWSVVREQSPGAAKKTKAKKMLLSGAFYLIAAAVASLASLCAFGSVFPVGLSVLCAAGEPGPGPIRKRTVPAMTFMNGVLCAGVIFSCLFIKENAFIYLLLYAAVMLSRLCLSSGRLDEKIPTKVTVCACGALLLGAVIYFAGGAAGGLLGECVTLCVASPVLCFLLCGFSGVRGTDEFFDGKLHLTAAAGALIYAVVGSIRDVNVFLLSAALILSVILTMSAAKTLGPLYGAVCGFICGLAQNGALIARHGTMYSAVLGISALFAGLLFEYSGTLAVMCAFCIACGYSLYSEGIAGFGSIAADYLVGLVIFFFVSRSLPERSRKKRLSVTASVSTRSSAPSSGDRYRARISKLSDAFESLSKDFFILSDKLKKPRITQASHVVSTTAGDICSGCILGGVCWGKEFSATREMTMRLALRLVEAGKIDENDVSENFRTKCVNLRALINGINNGYDRLCKEYFKNNRTRVLAEEYSTVSRLLMGTVNDIEKDSFRNTDAERLAASALAELDIGYSGVRAYGKRGVVIDVSGVFPERISASSKDITECFGRVLGGRFEEPAFISTDTSCVMRLRKARIITLECAKTSCAKTGENVNGDTTGFFESDSDRFYSLICDGMGSGREAALTSRLAALFIERLLTCSGEKGVALEMLNDFLLAQNGESFSTVDLLEVDMIDSKANFLKAGAASSFILRDGRLYKISSRTPPAGIIDRVVAEQTSVDVFPSDIIVMFSDGISDGTLDACPGYPDGAAGDDPDSRGETDKDGGGVWLLELLSAVTAETPSAISKRVLAEAKARRGRCDDMTVSVVRVVKNR